MLDQTNEYFELNHIELFRLYHTLIEMFQTFYPKLSERLHSFYRCKMGFDRGALDDVMEY